MQNDILPKRLSTKTMYESDGICLYADRVQMPDGSIIDPYHRLHYPHDSICVVIFNQWEEILLIRSKRYIIGRLEWEIPAGRIEKSMSSPLEWRQRVKPWMTTRLAKSAGFPELK